MPTPTSAEHAGYIVFKDRKVVVFYTNDLKATMSASMLPSTSPEAVYCCHGTEPLMRWTGDTIMHRKALVAPALIAAYNKCMNAVDRVDQLRSTNPTQRREKSLHMSVFTWLLDVSIINAYALQRVIGGSTSARVALREFKREIADTLTRNEKKLKQQRDWRQQKRKCDALDEAVGSVDSLHIITPNSTEHSNGKLTCYLCSLRGMAKNQNTGAPSANAAFMSNVSAHFITRVSFAPTHPICRTL
ncbi:unnamed protein product [Phytophthora fragariaefolia]|uniref:Unnamed protein product n=1 Tax=Phytophthora fragariaefolia TaxID=1490495 RepID=A0A9W6XPA0_9STRA|nr:unnamed protein product [Phytophthora fragariaefolia]